MKNFKSFLIILLAAAMIIACGCSAKTGSDSGSDSGSKSKNTGKAVIAEDFYLPQLEVNGANSTGALFLQRYNSAELSKTVKVDGVAEITLDSCFTTDKLKPENPTGSYSYLSPLSDSKMLICRGTIKNLSSKDALNSSSMYSMSLKTPFLVMMRINDKDVYIGNMAFSTPDGSNITDIVEPGAEATVYLFCNVENNVEINSVDCYVGLGDFSELVLDAAFYVHLYGEKVKSESKTRFDTIEQK